MSVIRGFVAVQLRTGDLHKPAELPYKVRHKSSHSADTFGDAVPSPVVPVRFLFRCIIVKVFLQHLRCNAEHMADPEPPFIVHQDIVEHPADVIQLLLRIRWDRLIHLEARIVLKPCEPGDDTIAIPYHYEWPGIDHPVFRCCPDGIHSIPLDLFRPFLRIH